MGGVEGAVSSRRRSPLRFILLVFALSVPFWVAGAVTGGQLTENLPLGALMAVCPVTAAAILVYREEGTVGVTRLLRRSFDYKRIKAKAWYVPILLLTPGVYALTYVVLGLAGSSVPNPQFPVLTVMAMIVSFFVLGLGEELGWSGYAIDPMQNRLGAFRAAVLLGLVWAVWHYLPLLQASRSAGWIAWWSLSTVALRVLITWVYNNNGKSVSAAAAVHAMTNVLWVGPFLDFGSGGYPYQAQAISALIMAAAAAIVTVACRPRTLTRQEEGQDRRSASTV